jgi:hypothetical protein
MQLAPSKIPGIFAESGQAGATQAATVTALRISFVASFAEPFGRYCPRRVFRRGYAFLFPPIDVFAWPLSVADTPASGTAVLLS